MSMVRCLLAAVLAAACLGDEELVDMEQPLRTPSPGEALPPSEPMNTNGPQGKPYVLEGDVQIPLDEYNREAGTLGTVAGTGKARLWDGGAVRYAIATDYTNTNNPATYYIADDDSRISWAVAHIEENTCIRFTKCDSPYSCQTPYIVFVSANGVCNSPVGTSGGVNNINLANGCPRGTVVHEILHSLGVHHEQKRRDRDEYIWVNESNINPGSLANFNTLSGGRDLGTYDYGSLMHYGQNAFRIDSSYPAIVSPEAIGQRSVMSQGDIDTIQFTYNGCSDTFSAPVCMANKDETATAQATPNEQFSVQFSVEWVAGGTVEVDYSLTTVPGFTTLVAQGASMDDSSNTEIFFTPSASVVGYTYTIGATFTAETSAAPSTSCSITVVVAPASTFIAKGCLLNGAAQVVEEVSAGSRQAVRCCHDDGTCTSSSSSGTCYGSSSTFTTAEATCASNSGRLCTFTEVDSGLCCQTGCSYDLLSVWIDNCVHQPCVHGSCSPTAESYTCLCDPGYGGETCNMLTEFIADGCVKSGEVQVVEEVATTSQRAVRCCHDDGTCTSSSSGTCYGDSNDFSTAESICASNSGRLCTLAEMDTGRCCSTGCNYDQMSVWIDNCASEPCAHGTCSATAESYTCVCDEGFFGDDCDEVSTFIANSCVLSGEVQAVEELEAGSTAAVRCCHSDGTCSSTDSSSTCYGSSVDFSTAEATCASNSGRLCTLSEVNARLCCSTGCNYDLLSVWIDNCVNDPCVHGTCVPTAESYTCVCDDGYSGATCSTSSGSDVVSTSAAPTPSPCYVAYYGACHGGLENCCQAGSYCKVMNAYYSQCVLSTA